MRNSARRLSLFTLAAFAAACAQSDNTLTAPDAAELARGADPHHGAPTRGHGTLVYGLTSHNELITFATDKPNQTIRSVRVTGLRAGDRLVGIDFRASDLNADGVDNIGRLYAVSSGPAGGAIYLIDPATGVATFSRALVTAGGAPVALSGTSFGAGFNPVVDRLRVHSDAEQNLRINVDNGLTISDAPLAFRSDDVNAGANPDVTGTAYRNSDADPATGTELYAIDAARDVLVEFPPPGGANGGQMATVGSLGVNTNLAVGFDIVGTIDGTGYAVLSTSPSGKSSLYTIDLDTGRATRVGLLAQTTSQLVSITVAP